MSEFGKKLSKGSHSAFWKIQAWKLIPMLDLHFLVKEIVKPPSNFAQRKVLFLSIIWYQVCWALMNKSLSTVSSQSVAVLELYAVFTYANSTKVLQFLLPPIDIHCPLLRVEFEDGLSISVLRDGPTRYKNCEFEIERLWNNCPHFLIAQKIDL